MRDTLLIHEPAQQPQIAPTEEDKKLIDTVNPSSSLNRFDFLEKLISHFSQLLMRFLHHTQESDFRDWIIEDERGRFSVGQLHHDEDFYPPHVIALRDLVNFLKAFQKNLAPVNELFEHPPKSIFHFIFTWPRFIFGRVIFNNTPLVHWLKLQESIRILKKSSIKNPVVNSAIDVYQALFQYSQDSSSNVNIIQIIKVMKDALTSSELFNLEKNADDIDSLLEEGKLPVKAQLELHYWKILFAMTDDQRIEAIRNATTFIANEPSIKKEDALRQKINEFSVAPAWNAQSIIFLEHLKKELLALHPDDLPSMTADQFYLYFMQLNSIVSQVIAVCPEFMAEDNDAGSLFRMLGTFTRMPVDMVMTINQKWFKQVMSWLGNSYKALTEDAQLKKLAESQYNIPVRFLCHLDQLETRLGLSQGLLTSRFDRFFKLRWSDFDSKKSAGPTEILLRNQTEAWGNYLQKQDAFRIKQKIISFARLQFLIEDLEKDRKKLCEKPFLQNLIYISKLNVEESLKLKKELQLIEKKLPPFSQFAKYIAKKLEEIETHIEKTNQHQHHSLSAVLGVTVGYVTQPFSAYYEKSVINAAINDTQKVLRVLSERENQNLLIAWREYRKEVENFDPNANAEQVKKHRQNIQEKMKALEEASTTEEVNSLNCEGAFLNATSAALAIQQFSDSSDAKLREEINKEMIKLRENAERKENHASRFDELSKKLDDADATLSLRGIDANITQENQANPSVQKASAPQVDSIEQLKNKLDNLITPLQKHIFDGQLYKESDDFSNTSLFEIRECDAQWIRLLKQLHNLLMQVRIDLSAFQDNLKHRYAFQESILLGYWSFADPYLDLINRLLKLFLQAGNILQKINELEPDLKQHWFEPVKKTLAEVRQFSKDLIIQGVSIEEIAQADAGIVQANPPALNAEPLPIKGNTQFLDIKKEVAEFRVELPSNLPARAELDEILTELSIKINDVLSIENMISEVAKGNELYQSSAFQNLMDLISKINAIAGSDFVMEKLSCYCTLLTEKLSAAFQKMLSQEIVMGYRSGVITENLYKNIALLADRGLIDICVFYDAQLNYVEDNFKNTGIKKHFSDYLKNLFKTYVDKKCSEWEKSKRKSSPETQSNTRNTRKLGRLSSWSAITKLKTKAEIAKSQCDELRKAQENRRKIRESRAIHFLKKCVDAPNREARKSLLEKYQDQKKTLSRLNRIAREITMTKWDIYYYESDIFNSSAENINKLIKSLEECIEKLASGEVLPDPETLENLVLDVVNQQSFPPAMKHLFMLAHNEIKKFTEALSQASGVFLPRNQPQAENRVDFVAPSEKLQKLLMDYVYKEVGRLKVESQWYERHIIESLEIFVEMWSTEKGESREFQERRKQILQALQAENAPDYKFLSNPLDVKIVYLLTVEGKHGLGFHKTIFSKDKMQEADNLLKAHDVIPSTEGNHSQVTPAPRSEGDQLFSSKNIENYQAEHSSYRFFSTRQGGHKHLTTQNILYLEYLRRRYVGDKKNTKAREKLAAIDNALKQKNPEALVKAVNMKTGLFRSNAHKYGWVSENNVSARG